MEKQNAYFTVEAALVLPTVIASMLFVIYMLFFQYDRCLLEQDIGAMAMWGSLAEASETEALEKMAQERIAQIYKDKYVAWKMTKLEVALDQNHFKAEGEGQLAFPAANWNFWSGKNVWGTTADYSYSRLSPVTFIRLCHKFKQYTGR